MNVRRRFHLPRTIPVVVLSLLTAAVGSAVRADEKPAPAPQPVPVITLDQAVQTALERQPGIIGARASLTAASLARDAAYSPMAVIAGPIIHVRRKQADLGVAIAQANVEQAEADAVHAVTRTYLSVLLAREQQAVAEEAVGNLKATYDVAKKAVEAGSKEITTNDLDRINTYYLLAQTRVAEARLGLQRAKAALKEAMGLANNCGCPDFEVGNATLLKYYEGLQGYGAKTGRVDCCCAAILAVQYRPEIAQASLAAQIACLEIDAQKLSMHPYSKTFAATGDIHAKVLPAAENSADTYRPGPLGPEYPVFLAGSRSQRIARAEALYERATAVVEKARGLITLEAEEACARLNELAGQVTLVQKAADQAAKLAKDSATFYRQDQLKTEQMLNAQVVEAQTKAQLNETLYRYGLAMAALQRATAGHLWDCVEKAPAK